LSIRRDLEKSGNFPRDGVPDGPESGQDFFLVARGSGRIGKAGMDALSLSQPERTFLGGAVADRNDEVEKPARELVHGLGPAYMLDADLSQSSNGHGVDESGRARPGRDGLPTIAQAMIDYRFRHLGSGRIPRAEEKDGLFHDHFLRNKNRYLTR
jgi:hypothetical protein